MSPEPHLPPSDPEPVYPPHEPEPDFPEPEPIQIKIDAADARRQIPDRRHIQDQDGYAKPREPVVDLIELQAE